MEHHEIKYGKYHSYLRIDLLKRNGKEGNIKELENVYIEMYKIFEKMDNTNNPIELYFLNQEIEQIEFKMQELWGFPIDRNMHRYWHECPKCTCPLYDNHEARGTQIRYYDPNCLIHGDKTKQLINREKKLNNIIYGKEN